ncbi:MAG: non-canonical purine NTP pyrophosphatase, RdgB/HAM1 family [[Chlorobium] sp. 445]|nr:MAG: non-canonical purine NTP pyrophosphatase, RdgB/HAM1 family [[Chlorobium] sp. 445]
MIKSNTDSVILALATRNMDKAREIKLKLHDLTTVLRIKSVDELEAMGLRLPEVEETQSTLEGNALKKAREIYAALTAQGLSNVLALSDDTGLEVMALGGAPGVHSARYAERELGRKPSYSENVAKLLRELKGVTHREAKFRTVIALVGAFHLANHTDSPYFESTFEGEVQGIIATAPRGEAGFGYDPIFEVQTLSKTFAELSMDEKNKVSHRALALERLQRYLQRLFS